MAREKLKTMLLQNFGVTNKEHDDMLWYFLEWSKGNGSHVHYVHVQRFQDSNERKDIKHSTCLG